MTHAGTTIGTFTGGTGTTPLVVTLNANATAPITEALVRAIAYRNVSDNPATAARTVRFVLTDGDGGTSAPATRAITLTAVNDPPVLAGIESAALAYTENDAAPAVTSSLTVSDPDSNITGATVTIDAGLAPAEDVLDFLSQLGITANYAAATGVLTLTGPTTPANYQTALRAGHVPQQQRGPEHRDAHDLVPGPGRAAAREPEQCPVPQRDGHCGQRRPGRRRRDVQRRQQRGRQHDADRWTTRPTARPRSPSPKKTITGDILAGDTDVDGPGPLTVTAGHVRDERRRLGDARGRRRLHVPPGGGHELHRHERLLRLHRRGQRIARADRHRHA